MAPASGYQPVHAVMVWEGPSARPSEQLEARVDVHLMPKTSESFWSSQMVPTTSKAFSRNLCALGFQLSLSHELTGHFCCLWLILAHRQELLEDEVQLKEYNATFEELTAAQSGSAEADPLAKFLSDPQAVWSWLQSSDKTGELMQIMRGSALFDKLLKFGSEVLERRQVAELGPGALVEISGLEAAEHLNGLTGTLCEATDADSKEHPGRRILELEDGKGRVAVQPRNLIFPRHRPGDAAPSS